MAVRDMKTLLRYLLVTVAIGALAITIACGGDTAVEGASSNSKPASQPASNFNRIRPSTHMYTAEEVVTAGFKKSQEYDVTGLEGATAAIYGFYGVDPYKRQEYELRFYASHDDAVRLGEPNAIESTGEDAKLTEEESTWDADLRERRECQGNVRGSHHVGKCLFPKYYDYAVLGNMVMLCQGHDGEEADKTCEELIKILPQN